MNEKSLNEENDFGFEPGRDRLAERAFAARTSASVAPDGGAAKPTEEQETNGDHSQVQVQRQAQAARQAEIESQSSHSESGSMDDAHSLPAESLPQTFQVKYLGESEAGGLWGIKHTRRPVDLMVRAAKELRAGHVLPLARLTITQNAVILQPIDAKASKGISFNIADISYGVQDLVYTRVFSMILVKGTTVRAGQVPFRCHGFVCESRAHARRVTYTLATAFRQYSNELKAKGVRGGEQRKKFAIDIRSPEEIEAQLVAELDSEA